MDFHELKMQHIDGSTFAFDQLKGQACLIVNLASQ